MNNRFSQIVKVKEEELNKIEMGSTIVLLSKNWKYDLKLKEKVYFGECIAKPMHSSVKLKENK